MKRTQCVLVDELLAIIDDAKQLLDEHLLDGLQVLLFLNVRPHLRLYHRRELLGENLLHAIDRHLDLALLLRLPRDEVEEGVGRGFGSRSKSEI